MRFLILLIPISIVFAGENWASPEDALGGLVSITTDYIQQVEDGLAELSGDSDIITMEWELIEPKLADFEQDWFITFLIKPDGSYMRPGIGMEDKNLSDRDYFPILMGGECFDNSFHVSKSTGKKSMMTGCPLLKNDEVVGAVGASIFLGNLGEMIREGMGLDGSSIFFIVNSDSMTIISSDNTDDFTYAMDMGNPSLKAAAEEIFTKKSGKTSYTYDGRDRNVYFTYDENLGWFFVYGDIEQ